MSFEAESPKKVCLCGDNKTYITNFRRLVKHNVSLLDLNFKLSKYDDESQISRWKPTVVFGTVYCPRTRTSLLVYP